MTDKEIGKLWHEVKDITLTDLDGHGVCAITTKELIRKLIAERAAHHLTNAGFGYGHVFEPKFVALALGDFNIPKKEYNNELL